MKINPKIRSFLFVIGTIVLIILINYILSFKFVRYDITADQRYSLKDETIALLEDEDKYSGILTVKIYFTGDLPADWSNYREEVMLKLEEYKVYAGSRFNYEFVDIYTDKTTYQEDLNNLNKLGLKEIVVSDFSEQKGEVTKTVPGIVLSYPDQEDIGVALLPVHDVRYAMAENNRNFLLDIFLNSQVDLEYKLTSAINKIVNRDKKNIAFLQGHGELDDKQTYSARSVLGEFYNISDVEILKVVEDEQLSYEDQIFHSLDNIDLLIVAKPEKSFNELEKFVLDQFIMNGGKVIWSLDMVNDNRDTLYSPRGSTYGIPYENGLNLTDQLHKYGVRIEPVLLLETLKNSAPAHIPTPNSNPNGPPIAYRIVDWELYPKVLDYRQPINGNPNNLADQHIISAGLAPVKMEYASYITVLDKKRDNVKKSVILETSDSTSFRRAPVDIFWQIIKQSKIRDKQYLPTAVLMEGEFESLWKNRLVPKELDGQSISFKEQSVKNKMLVLSDGDVFKNDIDSVSKPGMRLPVALDRSFYGQYDQRLYNLYYGNRDLLLNSVEYLLGENTILAVRRKFIPERLDPVKVEEHKNKWKFINILLPLLMIAVLGVIQLIIRKERYTK